MVAVAAAILATFHILHDKLQNKQGVIAFVVVLILAFINIILPSLNNFTGGNLYVRFSDSNSTGRSELAQSDFQAFFDNPVTGTGVGLSKQYHKQALGKVVTSHTELTRLPAEHGILGVLAIVILVLAGWENYIKAKKHLLLQGIIAAFVLWSLGSMGHAAMRTAAIGFMFGLSFIQYDLTDHDSFE